MIGDYGIMIGVYCIVTGDTHILGNQLMLFHFIWTGPDPLVLQMISRPYIRVAMDSLMQEPRAHIVLVHPRQGEEVPEETESLRRAGREFLKNCIIPNKEIDGKKPKADAYIKMRVIDVEANRIYGLGSQESVSVIGLWADEWGLHPQTHSNEGGCMFHTLRKGMKCPREFKNAHVRRMIVLFIIENFEMVWPILHKCILNNFGHTRLSKEEFRAKVDADTITDAVREAYTEPGPFSVNGYLENLLKPSFYGDELCLLILSMIWKVRITVLHARLILS